MCPFLSSRRACSPKRKGPVMGMRASGWWRFGVLMDRVNKEANLKWIKWSTQTGSGWKPWFYRTATQLWETKSGRKFLGEQGIRIQRTGRFWGYSTQALEWQSQVRKMAPLSFTALVPSLYRGQIKKPRFFMNQILLWSGSKGTLTSASYKSIK